MSRIVIDENKCKGCGLCTMACPFDLIHIADRFNAKGYRPAEYTAGRPRSSENLIQEHRCTGCANCAAMCPDVAITVYRTRSGAHVQTGTPAKLATDTPSSTKEKHHNKGNGHKRHPIRADTLCPADTPHPKTPERR